VPYSTFPPVIPPMVAMPTKRNGRVAARLANLSDEARTARTRLMRRASRFYLNERMDNH